MAENGRDLVPENLNKGTLENLCKLMQSREKNRFQTIEIEPRPIREQNSPLNAFIAPSRNRVTRRHLREPLEVALTCPCTPHILCMYPAIPLGGFLTPTTEDQLVEPFRIDFRGRKSVYDHPPGEPARRQSRRFGSTWGACCRDQLGARF
jgi:hypothetical protein